MASAKTHSQRCRIALPDNFRIRDVLMFHARDDREVAERVTGESLQKGLSWHGRPARLRIRFGAGKADADLEVDPPAPPAPPPALAATVRRMLGLTQAVEEFEARHRDHALLGPLLARQAGLRVPLSASPFEALTWAVTGQQISLRAAISLRRGLILLAGARHSSGIACYPDAEQVARLDEGALREAGFSQAKARALLTLSREISEGRLSLEVSNEASAIEEIRQGLLRVRGVGPWTVDYTLLRGFGWLDGSLHGDVAVRRNLQRLLGSGEVLTAAEAQRWLAGFSPWRALVAAHLWAMPA